MVKLSAAAAQIAANPVALELRRMQMVSEAGAENNSTTVLMIPADFVSLSNSLKDYLQARTARDPPPAQLMISRDCNARLEPFFSDNAIPRDAAVIATVFAHGAVVAHHEVTVRRYRFDVQVAAGSPV